MVSPEGSKLPNFTLQGVKNKTLDTYTLSEVASDSPVVLLFYVYDFDTNSDLDGTQLVSELRDTEFLTLNDDVRVLGISSDGVYSHQEFSNQNNISYPLLTDDNKEAYEKCDLLKPKGTRKPQRGMILIDSNREVQYSWAAEDNWDDWNISVLTDLLEVAETLK